MIIVQLLEKLLMKKGLKHFELALSYHENFWSLYMFVIADLWFVFIDESNIRIITRCDIDRFKH